MGGGQGGFEGIRKLLMPGCAEVSKSVESGRGAAGRMKAMPEIGKCLLAGRRLLVLSNNGETYSAC